jgi:hypothetical protein
MYCRKRKGFVLVCVSWGGPSGPGRICEPLEPMRDTRSSADIFWVASSDVTFVRRSSRPNGNVITFSASYLFTLSSLRPPGLAQGYLRTKIHKPSDTSYFGLVQKKTRLNLASRCSTPTSLLSSFQSVDAGLRTLILFLILNLLVYQNYATYLSSLCSGGSQDCRRSQFKLLNK